MLKKFVISIVVIIFSIIFWMYLINVSNEDKFDKNLTMSIGEKFTHITEEIIIPKNKALLEIKKNTSDYYRISVFVDGIRINRLENGNELENVFSVEERKITLFFRDSNNYNKFSKENRKITVKYELKNVYLIDEYTNASILNIRSKNCKSIKLEIPNKTDTFFILEGNNVTYKKISENEYTINPKGRGNTKVVMDSKIFNSTSKHDEEYISEENTEEGQKKYYNFIKTLQVVSALTLINMISSYMITKKIRVNKIYHRQTDDVIDVIFAENMIDKKINISNLIMAIIVQQIVRGNIIYENDTLTLLRYDNKSEIKNNILNMFFNTNKVINVKKLFSVFEDKQNVEKNVKQFKKIKKEINKLHYKYNIYNKKAKILLNVIRILAIILICIIYFNIIYRVFDVYIAEFIFEIFLFAVVLLYLNDKLGFGLISGGGIITFMLPIVNCIMIMVLSIWVYLIETKVKTVELIVIVVAILINFITIKKTKTHIFTKYGLEEYKKIKGLKNYIIDYSLMEERDMDAAIIWDNYLTYATAFGIPNKVTDKFSESLMNLAITINKINEIMWKE